MSFGASGYGVAYLNRIVYGSTISTDVMSLVYGVNGPGLFGTLGTRSSVNFTSSAVSSVPSLNFTPLRSLNSQVVGSTVFHDVAMPGIMCESGSISTSLPKMCSATLLLGKRLKKCGSMDVTSAATAILRSCAVAGAEATSVAAKARAPKRRASGTMRMGTSVRYGERRRRRDDARNLARKPPGVKQSLDRRAVGAAERHRAVG